MKVLTRGRIQHVPLLLLALLALVTTFQVACSSEPHDAVMSEGASTGHGDGYGDGYGYGYGD